MANKDSLGDRMKDYENCFRLKIPKKSNVMIRIDGKSFHTFTRKCDRPFDVKLSDAMINTMKSLCEEISGAKFGFTQSDEISILLSDRNDILTQPWFDNNLQKIVSISSSMATAYFNKYYGSTDKFALFDSRVFVLPKEEITNYLIWRQQDATRNSKQMAARANFSHKQCDKKNCNTLQEMLFTEKGINWNDYPTRFKRGTSTYKESRTIVQNTGDEPIIRNCWVVDMETPIFTQDREFVEKHIV